MLKVRRQANQASRNSAEAASAKGTDQTIKRYCPRRRFWQPLFAKLVACAPPAIAAIKWIMSAGEIIAEIPRLSHEERREIMRRIFEIEQDATTLAECDHLALERFQMLDAMEAEDEKNAAR